MNVYVLRHGTTVWNETRRVQGRSQNRLSKEGKILAEEAAQKLKDVPLDVIYSSPLMRTMQTANIVNQFHHLKINKNELLTEIDQGIFTKRFYKSLTPEEIQAKNEKRDGTKMESFEHIYERIKEFCENVLKKETHENVLVVSHNNPCSLIEMILNNEKIDFNDYKRMNSFKNAEIKKFKI